MELIYVNGLGVGLFCEGKYELSALVFQELIEHVRNDMEKYSNVSQVLAVAYYNLAVLKLNRKEMRDAKMYCLKGLNVCRMGGCGSTVVCELYRLIMTMDVMAEVAGARELAEKYFEVHKYDVCREYDSLYSFVFERRMLIA